MQEFDRLRRQGNDCAQVFSRCYACDGESPECRVCSGANEWPLLRCPRAVVEMWHRDVCQSIGYQEIGHMPEAGGWMNQVAAYVEATRVVMREKVAIDEAKRKRSEKKG